jgi:hypothetical protein
MSRLASFVCALACASCSVFSSTPTPMTEEKPPPSPIAARTEARLAGMAKFPPPIGGAKNAKRSKVVLAAAMDSAGSPVMGDRATVAFSFRILPPKAETAPELRDAAMLAATLDADGKNLVVAVRPTTVKVTITEEEDGGEKETTYEKVQILLARKRDEAGSHDARLHVARVFGLDVTKLDAKYEAATLQAFVLGTKLAKRSAPPAFQSPGEGPWTLLRIVSPGEGYLAIDWDAGRAELFPKSPEVTPLAEALLHVM